MFNKNVFWWFALLIWAGGSTYWHVCKIKELCYEQSTKIESDNFQVFPLAIKDGTNLDLVSKGNFIFPKSGYDPVLATVRPELDSLANYLASNPYRKVSITGYYSINEPLASEVKNLGLARAEKVKSYLIGLGVPDSVLMTNGELNEEIRFNGDSLVGGIEFSFGGTVATTEIDLAKAEKFENVFKPMDLYFPTGSSNYLKTDDNKKFVKEAVQFLKANRGKQLVLTGHTDNTGSEELNLLLSKKRAQAVKLELVNYGIVDNQLVVEARGELSPIESNETEAGRKANRRVEIVVK